MKEIFKRIEGLEWDIMGNKATKREIVEREIIEGRAYSLADLLANKSWCQAVWGNFLCACGMRCDHGDMSTPDGYDWEVCSKGALSVLQMEGQEACINYITKTMR